jgi:hypothetical protein
MTAPTGLLVWGQGGTYNALNDRAAINALANLTPGLVKGPTFTAGSGLAVNIGPFSAIVSCGDSSLAVAASTSAVTVTETAGPGSGSRTDIVWLDIDPTAATWSINLRTQADTVGRLGYKLGQITMPQGSNLASQATLTPAVADWAPFPRPITPVSVSLYRSGAISCGNGVWVNVGGAGLGWNTEDLGSAATLWTAAGFVAPTAGVYLVSGRCSWSGTSNVGYRGAAACKNGTQLATSQSVVASGASVNGSQLSAYPAKCIAGDVLSLQVQQNTGATSSMLWAQMSVVQQS